MNDSAELLALRLGMLAVIFVFVFAAALIMRSGLRSSRPAAAAASPRQAGPRLVVLTPANTGLRPGTEFMVGGEMQIGRDGGNGIVLGDPSVSSRHAAIMRVGRDWLVSDLGSTNGTFVNGRMIDGRGVALHGGEKLVFGAVVLRFQP